MTEPRVVHVFRHSAFAVAGDTIMAAAPLDLVVLAYGGDGRKGEQGLIDAFGGAAFFRDDATGSSWLGVWGARKASRFRAVLRAYAPVVLVWGPPPARLAWYTTRAAGCGTRAPRSATTTPGRLSISMPSQAFGTD